MLSAQNLLRSSFLFSFQHFTSYIYPSFCAIYEVSEKLSANLWIPSHLRIPAKRERGGSFIFNRPTFWSGLSCTSGVPHFNTWKRSEFQASHVRREIINSANSGPMRQTVTFWNISTRFFKVGLKLKGDTLEWNYLHLKVMGLLYLLVYIR